MVIYNWKIYATLIIFTSASLWSVVHAKSACCAIQPSPNNAITQDTTSDEKSVTDTEIDNLPSLHCLVAHEFCLSDSACNITLSIIHKLCGPESITCSSMTAWKCHLALKMLLEFPVFKKQCLCKTLLNEPECNVVRSYIYDHPCTIYAKDGQEHRFPIQQPFIESSTPSCTQAYNLCQKNAFCDKTYNNFIIACTETKTNTCTSLELCKNATKEIRFTPLFGCICTDEDGEDCRRIFSEVNRVSNCLVPKDWKWIYRLYHDDRKLSSKNKTWEDFLACWKLYPSTDISKAIHVFRRQYSNILLTTLSVDAGPQNDELMNFQSTCHIALRDCQSNKKCRKKLYSINKTCNKLNESECIQSECRTKIQKFYRSDSLEPFAMEMAFCLCKKTNDSESVKCMKAQNLLHPVCAIKTVNTTNLESCDVQAQKCKLDRTCRKRLIFYEQACATDNLTKQCAGYSFLCRKAMLGILGTPLRTACICKDANVSQTCIGWQRVLWFNPCVVEAQREFHMDKVRKSLQQNERSKEVDKEREKEKEKVKEEENEEEKENTQNTIQTSYILETETESPDDEETSTTKKPSKLGKSYKVANKTYLVKKNETDGVNITSDMVSCSMNRFVDYDNVTIPFGRGIRIFRPLEDDCSELCVCNRSSMLSCSTECREPVACENGIAIYHHYAQTIRAFRRYCICYSGEFICVRAVPTGQPPPGLLLYLGYVPPTDDIINVHFNYGLEHTIVELETFMRELLSSDNITCCFMLLNWTPRNFLILIRHKYPYENVTTVFEKERTLERLDIDKKLCYPVALELKEIINTRRTDFTSNPLLSPFKIADVQMLYPPLKTNMANIISPISLKLIVFSILVLFA